MGPQCLEVNKAGLNPCCVRWERRLRQVLATWGPGDDKILPALLRHLTTSESQHGQEAEEGHEGEGGHHDEEEGHEGEGGHHAEEEGHEGEGHEGEGGHHDEEEGHEGEGGHHDDDEAHEGEGGHHDDDEAHEGEGGHHDDDEAHGHGGGHHDDERPSNKPWGRAIGAAICVQMATLTGVVLLVPGVRRLMTAHPNTFGTCQNGFAAGAILAAGFYFLLFESVHLIEAGSNNESQAVLRWGSPLLAGIISAGVMEGLCILVVGHKLRKSVTAEDPAEETVGAAEEGKLSSEKELAHEQYVAEQMAARMTRYRIWAGVLLGDFMHNLCDGLFIGSAFLLCGNSIGWSVTVATILHELAQMSCGRAGMSYPA
eukprot:scaffold970_cov412-Prasinococcus_capsulatus_cf.AAC.2